MEALEHLEHGGTKGHRLGGRAKCRQVAQACGGAWMQQAGVRDSFAKAAAPPPHGAPPQGQPRPNTPLLSRFSACKPADKGSPPPVPRALHAAKGLLHARQPGLHGGQPPLS